MSGLTSATLKFRLQARTASPTSENR